MQFIEAKAQCSTCKRTVNGIDTGPDCPSCGGTGTQDVMLPDWEVKRLINNWAVAAVMGDVYSGTYASILTPDL